MIIQNAKVFDKQGVFVSKDIYIEKERIASSNQQSQDILDASGCLAVPGFIDIHFHGCMGYDFCDGTMDAIQTLADYELKNVIMAICPATMTLPEDTLLSICRNAASYKNEQGADFVGINMEGPFIAHSKMGAQNPSFIQETNYDVYKRLQVESGNLIRLVDIAPEKTGSMEFIQRAKDEVVISLAHTSADYETALEAFQKGASHVTHLYNAMMPYTHRAPGVIGAACDTPHCYVELICDGIHIHPSAVRTTFKMFGDDRIVFISDSMMATGMNDGEYSLGGQKVKVVGNLATLENGTIAGSATNLMECFRFAVQKMGIPLESAVKCATMNPAKSIGIFDEYGSIEEGKYANILLLDEHTLEIKTLLFKGTIL